MYDAWAFLIQTLQVLPTLGPKYVPRDYFLLFRAPGKLGANFVRNEIAERGCSSIS